MKRRIFVATVLPDSIQNLAKEWSDSYQNLPVRWLTQSHLHITLVPPWYTEAVEQTIEQLKSQNYQISPFIISLQTISFGPDLKRPRLIWASGPAPRELVELKSKLELILGIKPERRQFLLHVTLARFKESEFQKFPTKKVNEKVQWVDKITSFAVMESILTPKGAIYSKLEEIHL